MRNRRDQAQLTALGRAIRHLRRERNLSRRTVAEEAGISRLRLWLTEAGLHNIQFDRLYALGEALEVGPAALLAEAIRLEGGEDT